MRILLTGVQKSGKTTLVSYYENRFSSIEILNEVAREIISKNPNIVEDPKFQDILFKIQIENEKKVAKKIKSPFSSTKVAILDRSILDNIVYTRFLAEKFPEKDFQIKREWLDYIEDNPYDKVFLCDPRDVDYDTSMSMYFKKNGAEARMQLHSLYIETLEKYEIHYELLSGSVEDRIKHINFFIEFPMLQIEGMLEAIY